MPSTSNTSRNSVHSPAPAGFTSSRSDCSSLRSGRCSHAARGRRGEGLHVLHVALFGDDARELLMEVRPRTPRRAPAPPPASAPAQPPATRRRATTAVQRRGPAHVLHFSLTIGASFSSTLTWNWRNLAVGRLAVDARAVVTDVVALAHRDRHQQAIAGSIGSSTSMMPGS